MIKTLVLLLTFVASVEAAHANSCLKNASDQDLLSEIATRMGDTKQDSNAIVSFGCRYQNFYVSSINTETGDEKREEMTLNDSASCTTLEHALTTKLANKPITRPVVFAGCNFSKLQKISIHPNGNLTRLADQVLTDSMTCIQTRDRINDAI